MELASGFPRREFRTSASGIGERHLPAGRANAHPSSMPDLSSRRGFIARASALSLVIPGVGSALAACSPDGGASGDSTQPRGAVAGGSTSAGGARQPHNSDSRLDSALLEGEHHGGTSATGTATQGAGSVAY